MHGPITSVADADEVRYERREAEKRSGGTAGQEEQEGNQGSEGHQGSAGQEGHQGHQGHKGSGGNYGPRGPDGQIWSADWRPSGARRGGACRVNLSAAFEAEWFEAEWNTHAAAALRLDS